MTEVTFLTIDEVVQRYRGLISHGTLNNWRSMGQGPAFFKAGKAILYPLESLVKWEQKNMKSKSTSRVQTYEGNLESNT